MERGRKVVLFGVSLLAVWWFCANCAALRGAVSQIPLTGLVLGSVGSEVLGPVGTSLVLTLISMMAVLAVIGFAAFLQPTWLFAVYSLVIPLPILIRWGTGREFLILAGLLGCLVLYHLGQAAGELHSRLVFRAGALSKGKSWVAMVLLVLAALLPARGGIELLDREGPELLCAVEERAIELIDTYTPQLIEMGLGSVEDQLPEQFSLGAEDFEKHLRESIPSGAEIVQEVKKQLPRMQELVRSRTQEFRARISEGTSPILKVCVVLGVVSSLWGMLGALLLAANGFVLLSSLLTRLLLLGFKAAGLIEMQKEEVELDRMFI